MTDQTERRDCPGCGMPRDIWPDDSTGGFIYEHDVYCCKDCATTGECTCILSGNRTQETHALLNEHLQDNPGIPNDPVKDGMKATRGPTSPTDR